MSARKVDSIQASGSNKTPLSLHADEVKIRKSGIEFRLGHPIPPWTELSVDLQYPDAKKVHCTGVVVECDGNRHAGYLIALLFTNLSRQSQDVIRRLT